jgi:hypothetical protein
MPDTLRKDLAEGIRGIVEAWVDARPRLARLLHAASRTRETRQGSARRSNARAPADFPISRIEVELLGHSGWSQARSLAAQQQAFKDATAGFTVVRDARVTLTLRYALPDKDDKEYDPAAQVSLPDEAVNALFAAGPRLGLAAVASAPTFRVTERDTQGSEAPKPGKVATITIEFQCQQSGRDLLAQISAP